MQADQRALDDSQRAVVIRAGRSVSYLQVRPVPVLGYERSVEPTELSRGLGHSLVSPEEP